MNPLIGLYELVYKPLNEASNLLYKFTQAQYDSSRFATKKTTKVDKLDLYHRHRRHIYNYEFT